MADAPPPDPSSSPPPSPEYDPQKDYPTVDPRTFLFGRYYVERELGRGGMGVVLLARDSKLGQ